MRRRLPDTCPPLVLLIEKLKIAVSSGSFNYGARKGSRLVGAICEFRVFREAKIDAALCGKAKLAIKKNSGYRRYFF